jgi:hypothetical protein
MLRRSWAEKKEALSGLAWLYTLAFPIPVEVIVQKCLCLSEPPCLLSNRLGVDELPPT